MYNIYKIFETCAQFRGCRTTDGGSGLLLSQFLSLVVGAMVASVAVFCLSMGIFGLQNLLKIVAILEDY